MKAPFRFTKQNFIIAGVLGVILLVGLFFAGMHLYAAMRHPVQKPFDAKETLDALHITGGNNNDTYRIEETLKDIIQKYSIEDGFKLIDQGVQEKQISNDECHNLLHYVGHAAYAKYKNDYPALMNVVQGTSCIGGYLHGIEAEIVLTSPDVINDLKSFCAFQREKNINPGPCYHGAGHAAVELYGYDIPKAISLCDALEGGIETDLTNCYRGVFSQISSVTLGFDGDTGLAVSQRGIPGLDKENPMEYCTHFAEKYQSSCESQLVLVLVSGRDMDNWMDACLSPKLPKHTQEICINITSVVYIRGALSFANSAILPKEKVNALPEDLRKIAIMGTLEGFAGYFIDHVQKDWHPFCDEFTLKSDVQFCLDSFDQTVNHGKAPWMDYNVR